MAATDAPKRKLRDILPQLAVSACALLLPPLGMAAGVMYLGSSQPQENRETVASGAAEPAASVAAVVRAEPVATPDPGPALASSAQSEQPAPSEQQVALAATPAPVPAAASPASAKDAAPVLAAPSATPANVGETPERAAPAEAAPVEKAGAPAADGPSTANAPGQSVAGQKSRHDGRSSNRVRQARVPSLTDIFRPITRMR